MGRKRAAAGDAPESALAGAARRDVDGKDKSLGYVHVHLVLDKLHCLPYSAHLPAGWAVALAAVQGVVMTSSCEASHACLYTSRDSGYSACNPVTLCDCMQHTSMTQRQARRALPFLLAMQWQHASDIQDKGLHVTHAGAMTRRTRL